MKTNLILYCCIFFISTFGFTQYSIESDTLIFEYDESYFSTYEHTPDSYFIADLPLGNGFYLKYEKGFSSLQSAELLNFRDFVYQFKKKYTSNVYANLDVDLFIDYLGNKSVFLKKGDGHIQVVPTVEVE
ncbi:hypothetical protein FEE95_21770 [Maribacter algarum]|uniref:Uncharacterized protein n=1 Tax=Maribacter algarum (ex Zhang et al. 2020) TaxID=2578118 RepID=A0A5S3PCC9_9FLAO|nr:hypothetical protein [Maribacter algarum]TMM51519.1 hypothetical protein FEE95_21770 [Maribacter algarum]